MAVTVLKVLLALVTVIVLFAVVLGVLITTANAVRRANRRRPNYRRWKSEELDNTDNGG